MSKTLESIDVKDTLDDRNLCYTVKNKHKRVLKSRENIFKPKYNRELKKKLKKYKLRRDGIEDPDILDVSKILVTSLRIKSPNNKDKINCNNNIVEQEEQEELNQGNYLIRMVRRKKNCSKAESLVSVLHNNKTQNDEGVISIVADEAGDKKRNMDAFKLMMDSRNKSIGSNSPGKEKTEEQESKETAERKEIKAKRILSLQKMALSKGSLKNKESEELRDKCIEKKMVKRAERLKEMLTKMNSESDKKIDFSEKQSQTTKDNSDLKTKPTKIKSYMLCDILNETTEIIDHTKQSKSILNDDIEFLNKLSPSIKKKENMLSYFQKITKDDSEQLENDFVRNDESVIKVKFNSKRKKKTKLSSVDILTTPEIVENKVVAIDNSKELPHIKNHKRLKRKRNLNVEEGLPIDKNVSNKNGLTPSYSESRPKRNIKKPFKYTEDVQIFSSDEELHIFTPKKKKNNEKPTKSKLVDTTEELENGMVNSNIVSEVSKKNESKNKIKSNKIMPLSHVKGGKKLSLKSSKPKDKIPVKLAPIFAAKTQLSPLDIEAKQRFLKSGVPEKLKKKVQNHINVMTFDMFPSVLHIQQGKQDTGLHQEKDWFSGSMDSDEFNFKQNECSFKNLLMLEEVFNCNIPVINQRKPEQILKSIKCAYPKFPVYRTYHLLSGKRKGEFKDCTYPDLDNSIEIISGQYVDINNENPDQLNWCDKYKPTSSKQIIGNFESVKELKKWLETWTENLFKAKQIESDSSDFSDFYHSDDDSRNAYRNTNNVLILTGQTGSGKTSSVYAVASELAIKVIEVNASSKRTGKIMLQDLQEATQSHKVNRAKSGSDNSQKLQDEIIPKNIKKYGRPNKVHNGKLKPKSKSKQASLKTSKTSQTQILASQENSRTGMSLILIDDADIVFEQDDGFCSAIAQLVQSSKRPVILVASSLKCSHLQRFVQYGKVLHMRPVLSRMLGTWLDVMCLVDVGKCCTGLGAKMLDFHKGDIRKTINCLQFYMNSNKHTNQGDEVALSQFKHKIDDEDSSMSWGDSESSEAPVSNNIDVDSYIDKQLQLLNVGCPLTVFSFWWNLPTNFKDYNSSYKHGIEENSINEHCNKEQGDTERLNRIAQVLDTISVIDYFDHNNPDTGTNVSRRLWHAPENASLFENENFECYNKSSFVTKEICNVLIDGTAAQKEFKQQNSLNLLTSTISIQRNRDKIITGHNRLSSYLHPAVVLDRRATALDYWATCRSICRIEKNRTDSNLKRNNRFCHYLKSLNILGKNDFYDSLADSLT